MLNYTKGEWKTQQGSEHTEGECCIISELGYFGGLLNIRTIGKVFDYAGTQESKANAQLIAQSPRMAEFIEKVVKQNGWLNQADFLEAKAIIQTLDKPVIKD